MEDVGTIIFEFDMSHRSYKRLSLTEFSPESSGNHMIYWVHSDLSQKETFAKLADQLHLSEDIMELCLANDGMPKLIDEEGAIALQIQCLQSLNLDKHDSFQFDNLILNLTQKYCFTASFEKIPAVLECANSINKTLRFAKTPCFIFFLILDNIVNDYSKILFQIELVADQMDLHVRASHKNIYNKVMRIKQQVMKIKRYVISIREILMRLSGRNIEVISEPCRVSLSNLSNHTHMLAHEVESIRDMLNGLLDQIDNTLIQKMSETMKILTAFAAIFLPMTVITGIYGMNFRWMPELQWKYGYLWAMSLILFCGISLLILFRKRKWF
ncbi:MAG: magnesium transporter CorA family protein [Gammaproteobacteria bacterium]|nr:magnesium transporter CorA family protein [Gammaproteobacteria bacterium]